MKWNLCVVLVGTTTMAIGCTLLNGLEDLVVVQDAGTERSVPSCVGLTALCGPEQTESCCASSLVGAGPYRMGRCGDTYDAVACTDGYDAGDGGIDERPEHDASISAFQLDKYEVTVGRFRKFVEAYDGWTPSSSAGDDPIVTADTGWQSNWDSALPVDAEALEESLECPDSDSLEYPTWTNGEGPNEKQPINCVTWFEAFAFCAWDDGWLPTEAEWEKAAAGGDENRLYPWGADAPDPERAVFHCWQEGDPAACYPTDVGSITPEGVGRYGQYDLAGNVSEWTRDSYDGESYAGDPCTDCVDLRHDDDDGGDRVVRGGHWVDIESSLRAASREYGPPVNREYGAVLGIRCGRRP